MTNNKVPYDAVPGKERIHKQCGSAVSDIRKVKFDSCAAVDEISDKLTVDAIAKIKALFLRILKKIYRMANMTVRSFQERIFGSRTVGCPCYGYKSGSTEGVHAINVGVGADLRINIRDSFSVAFSSK
jgi:hypothetical protein